MTVLLQFVSIVSALLLKWLICVGITRYFLPFCDFLQKMRTTLTGANSVHYQWRPIKKRGNIENDRVAKGLA